jgi:PAS domain S-box-containing protein
MADVMRTESSMQGKTDSQGIKATLTPGDGPFFPYGVAFENALNPMFILDSTTRILALNPAAVAFLKAPPDRIKRMRFFDLSPDFGGSTPLDASFLSASKNLEMRFITDGENKTLLLNAARLTLSSDDVFLVVGQDITERKRLEELIIKAKREWESTFDSIPDPIFIVNRDFSIRRLNRAMAEMLGLEPREAVGRFCHELVDNAKAPPKDCLVSRVFQEGRQLRQPIRLEALGRWFSAVSSPLGDKHSPAALVVLSDITALKKAEEANIELERREAERRKHESLEMMAGGIAHQFNNILMAVMGNIELAMDDLPSSNGARARLMKAFSSAKRAADIAKLMLVYSGRLLLNRKETDISALAKGAEAALRYSLPQGATLRMELAESIPPVLADSKHLRQVLDILVRNAAEALEGRPGDIVVATGLAEGSPLTHDRGMNPPGEKLIFLDVRDNGKGMDPDTLRRLFDPFFSTKFLGRGLGMAAVLGIAKAHGGSVIAESSPGAGTRIRLLFPPAGRMR